MGCLIVESTQSQTRTEETITENGSKDKKKNRRSRRSKRNSSLSGNFCIYCVCTRANSIILSFVCIDLIYFFACLFSVFGI